MTHHAHHAQHTQNADDARAAQATPAPTTQARPRTTLVTGGTSNEFAELFGLILDGRNAHLASGVEEALGREPRDFADFARAAAATGVWNA